jgi:acetyl esterase/lipase
MKQNTLLTCGLFLLLVGPLFAQRNNSEDAPRGRPDPLARFFTLPGIEFSPEQRAKVEAIRKQFAPKLAENQQKWNGIITPEQQQAQREAFRKAREAGKEGRELRAAADAAVKLTAEQQKQRADIQAERIQLQLEIRTQLTALLTDEQRTRAPRPNRAGPRIPPTHADVKYGPHGRNVLDVWLAKSDRPTPVLVSIHGGGFRGGNKSVRGDLLNQCLESGISVVAITYRLSGEAIAPAQFHDAARAIQFIRHNAKSWNIDSSRIAATGGSAGAGLSLWLGFHDDLADADSDDPVLRQSTRLTCMMVTAGQTSYDPRVIRKLFPGADTYQHSALAQLYDVDLEKLDELPEEKYKLFEECSPITHLTKDDAPAMLSYGGTLDQKINSAGVGIHHARFGEMLKKQMDALQIRCIVNAGGEVLGGGERLSPIEFLKQEFKMAE